jgi:hypothetical protein
MNRPSLAPSSPPDQPSSAALHPDGLDRAVVRAQSIAHDLASDLNYDVVLVRDAEAVLDRALIQSRDLNDLLNRLAHVCGDPVIRPILFRISESARDLDPALFRGRERARLFAPAIASHLASDMADARGCAFHLEQLLELVVEHLEQINGPSRATYGVQRSAVRIAPSANRLLTAAARLLPADGRARYAEEYATELWEIAETGAGRRQQIHYALRQLIRAAPLRSSVRAPRRKHAAQ